MFSLRRLYENDRQTITIYFMADYNGNRQVSDDRRSSRDEQGNSQAFRRAYRFGEGHGGIEQIFKRSGGVCRPFCKLNSDFDLK